ncbi:MAG: hypothetical protein ACKVQA_17210 [Burkholderiales bacterium]
MRAGIQNAFIACGMLSAIVWSMPLLVLGEASDAQVDAAALKNQIEQSVQSKGFTVDRVAVRAEQASLSATIEGTIAPGNLSASREEFRSAPEPRRSAIAGELATQSFRAISDALPLNVGEELAQESGSATSLGASFKYRRRLSGIEIEDGVVTVSLDQEGRLKQLVFTGPGHLPPSAITALSEPQLDEPAVDDILNEHFAEVAHLPTIQVQRESNGGRICRTRKTLVPLDPFLLWLADCGMAVCRIDARSGVIISCEATRVFAPGF